MPSSPDAAPAPRSDSETRILGGWLNEPLAGRWCMLGWGVATGLFVALATLTGGPGRIDAAESVYSTWAIAHGRLSCAFPSVTMPHEPLVAPVYPVVSGFVAALAGIGHTVPFPPQARDGPSLRDGGRRRSSLGPRGRSPRADAVGRLHRLVGPRGRRRGVAARLGEGALPLGAGDRDRGGLSSPRLDLHLVLLPSTGPVRHGVRPGRDGLRATGPVGRRGRPHRAGRPLPAVRPPGCRAAPGAGSEWAPLAVRRVRRGGGGAGGPSPGRRQLGARPARGHLGLGRQPLHRRHRPLGAQPSWAGGRGGLAGAARRAGPGVVVVGHAPGRSRCSRRRPWCPSPPRR